VLLLYCHAIYNTETSRYGELSNEDLDELEACVVREKTNIRVKEKEKKHETAEKIGRTHLQKGIAKFEEAYKKRNNLKQLGLGHLPVPGWIKQCNWPRAEDEIGMFFVLRL